MDIRDIRELTAANKIKWSTRCLQRMGERDISIADVKICISSGEIIEDYPDDYPHPSCLIFGYALNKRIIHVVVGSDTSFVYVITTYEPNLAKFEDDMKTRRL